MSRVGANDPWRGTEPGSKVFMQVVGAHLAPHRGGGPSDNRFRVRHLLCGRHAMRHVAEEVTPRLSRRLDKELMIAVVRNLRQRDIEAGLRPRPTSTSYSLEGNV